MKRFVYILLFVLASLSMSAIGESSTFSFRDGIQFGMGEKEVIQLENNAAYNYFETENIDSNKGFQLCYYPVDIFGVKDGLLIYEFNDDVLTNIGCGWQRTIFNTNQSKKYDEIYISFSNKLHNMIKKNYTVIDGTKRAEDYINYDWKNNYRAVDNKELVESYNGEFDNLDVEVRKTDYIIIEDGINRVKVETTYEKYNYFDGEQIIAIDYKVYAWFTTGVMKSDKKEADTNISNNEYKHCSAEGCNKLGNHRYIGLSGKEEYYCDEHYKKLNDMIEYFDNELENNQYICDAEGCKKEATHKLTGITGVEEYYCDEHYNKLLEYLDLFSND